MHTQEQSLNYFCLFFLVLSACKILPEKQWFFSPDYRILTTSKARGHGLRSVIQYGQDIRKKKTKNPEVLERWENGRRKTDLNNSLVLETSFLRTCNKVSVVIKRIESWDFVMSRNDTEKSAGSWYIQYHTGIAFWPLAGHCDLFLMMKEENWLISKGWTLCSSHSVCIPWRNKDCVIQLSYIQTWRRKYQGAHLDISGYFSQCMKQQLWLCAVQ